MPNQRFRRIQASELTPGAKILVRGNVTYSHVASHIQGDELRRDIERRRAAQRPVIEKPYVTISVSDAQVIFKNPKAGRDPALRTPEEAYVEQRLYTSMKSTRPGMCFTAISRSPVLPWVAELRPPNIVEQRGPAEHELATGTEVTIVMIVFQSRFGPGVGLDGIISHEPLTAASDDGGLDLSDYGYVFIPASRQDSKD